MGKIKLTMGAGVNLYKEKEEKEEKQQGNSSAASSKKIKLTMSGASQEPEKKEPTVAKSSPSFNRNAGYRAGADAEAAVGVLEALKNAASRTEDTVTGAAKGWASSLPELIGMEMESKREAESYRDRGLQNMYQDQIAEGKANADTAAKLAKLQKDMNSGVKDRAIEMAYAEADRLSQSSAEDIARAKEGLGGLGQFLVDAGVAGTQMMGDIAAGTLTGGSALIPMGIRVFGGSSQQARQGGATLGQRAAYGLGSAALSVVTEQFANVAAPFKKAFGTGVLDKAISNVTGKLGQSAVGQIALAALSEGGEEFAEAVFQPILQRATYNKDASFNLEEALYDAAVGAVLGGVGAGISPSTYIHQTTADTVTRENVDSPAPDNAGVEIGAEAGVDAAQTKSAPEGVSEANRTGVQRKDVLETAKQTLGEKGYQAFEAAYREDIDADVAYRELTRAYNEGMANNRGRSTVLTEAQYGAMFEAGRSDAAASIEAQAKQAGYATVHGKNSGLVYDDYVAKNVDKKTAKAVNTVAKALGIKVQFADEVAGGDANAEIENGIVTIEKGNPNPVRFLFGHEITHRMQELAPTEYARLREAVVSGGWADAAIKRIQDNYTNHGRSISSEAALDEAVADYVGSLLEDSGELERFVRKHQTDRTLLEKLRDVVRDLVRKLKGSGYDTNLRNVEKLLSETLDAAVAQVNESTKAQKNTTQKSGVKHSVGSNPYRQKSLSEDSSVYSYDFLVNLPDMNVVEMPALSEVKTENKVDRQKAIQMGIENAAQVGRKVTDTTSAVMNRYTGREIRVSQSGLGHSLGGENVSRLRTNARLTAVAGSIIENAVPVNALKNTNPQVHGTYAMACLLKSGDMNVVAIVTVEQHTDRVTGIDYVDIAHSINGRLNTKKESSRSSTGESGTTPATATSTVSIADFLEIVNNTHQSILSNDVLSHFGTTRNLNGYYTNRVKFSLKDIESRVENGKPINASDEALYSLKYDKKFMENAMQTNAQFKRVSGPVMQRAAEARQAVADIFNDPELAESLGLPPDIIGKTYIPNGSYSGTEENTTVCIRSIAADALMDAVAEQLGRPLTVEDTIAISQEYWKYTDKPECLYCYVAMDRKAHREFMGSYLEQRDMVLEAIRKGEDKDKVYQKFLDGRKDTKPMRDRFHMWLKNADKEMITPADLASYANMDKAMERNPALKPQINDALKYAQSASWAKKRISYAAYNGHILKWKKTRIDSLNSNYGLRMYSFSDFSPAFILENMQMITDAAVRNLKMLAYTKELDFVRIFAKTGMNINISVFGYDDGRGGVAMDGMQGADWAEAQSLRNQYKNVGCTFVATNDAQVNWALGQDWIDVIIPFHMVRTGTKVADHFGWKNYTAMSADTKTKAFDSAKNAAHILPPMHQNNKARYLQACKDNNLNPRFSDWVDHPNYMKLVNETRQSEAKTKPVQPIFDVDAAKASIEDMRKRGGYYKPIGGSTEEMYGIAEEIADSINRKAKFSLKDSASLAREIARIQKEGKANKRSEADIQADIRAVVQETYQSMLGEYGSIDPGENPAREVQVPKRTAKDKKVSQTVRTILEAGATPDEIVPNIEQMVATGDFSYDVYSDKEAIADAETSIRRVGWAQALNDWTERVKAGEVSKKNTAMGWALYNNAANSGDTQTALTILENMVSHQRNAAQALQATRILKKLSPETQLYLAQRSVENLQEELNERYGRKGAPELKVNEELAEQYMNATSQEERDEILKDIYRDIGRQVPPRFIDKWNAWRYLAMLGNPRTHVRNVVGNAGFAPVVAAKNMTATAIESIVSRVSGGKLNRTKGAVGLGKNDRALLSAAWNDYDKVQETALSGGKYSDFANANKYIEEGRVIFKNKALEAARKGNSKALDAEDVWFSKPHYAAALAQYCKAHGLTAEQIARGKEIKNARAYAILEAQKATYRDTNAFSQTMSELGRTVRPGNNPVRKGVGLVMEGILPFRKTPANILARGVEYSPIGLMTSLTKGLRDVQQGRKTGAEVIDSISAGLTGTGLLALGVYLAAQGLVRGHGSGDEDKNKYEELMGHQAYALELPNGTSITLDWLAPECLPLFIGVNLWEQTEGEKDQLTLSTMLNAVTTVTEPLLEMSCLQSLNDVFDAVGYATSDGLEGLPAALASAATSYLTQALPTILGQAERTGEDQRYTTYTEKNAFLTSDIQYTLGRASARLPGLEYQQIPYIDAWGRTEMTGGTGTRAFNNFLNPAYTSSVEASKMEEELLRLYEQTGEGGVLPSRAAKYFNVDGERKDLTGEEYVKYAKKKGQTAYDVMTSLTKSSAYKALSDGEKVDAVKKVYEYANAVAKASVSGFEPDGWVAKAIKTSKKTGVKPEQYVTMYLAQSNIVSLKDAKGETIDNSKGLQIMQMIYSTSGLTEAQRQALFEDFGVGKTVRHYSPELVKQKLNQMKKQAK